MTKFYNEIKFVPSTPKTYEVRYVENENKQSSLSPAARSKIVNRSGSNYVSERTTIVNPGYGPGFWDNVEDWLDKNAPVIALRASIAAVSVINPAAGVAMAAGMAGGGVIAKAAGEISGNEDAKETGRVLIQGSSDRLSEAVVDKGVEVVTNLSK